MENDTLHGMEQPAGDVYTISGHIVNENGAGIGNAKVFLTMRHTDSSSLPQTPTDILRLRNSPARKNTS